MVAERGNRRVGSILCIAVQSPQVFLCISFQPNLLLGALTQRLNPNDPKLCLVLPILNYDRTPHLELAANRTQSNPSLADIEGMDQVGVGIARSVVAKNSYRQHCLGPVYTAFIVHRMFHLFRTSFVRRI